MTYPALNIYNRYFHTTQESPQQSSIPFEDNVDMDHTLAAIGLAAGLVHTADNRVEYFRLSADKKYEDYFSHPNLFYIADKLLQLFRFASTNTSSFRIGDIVEAHFSLVVVPVKQRKFQMILVLRGLALLDSTQSQVFNSCLPVNVFILADDINSF
jgi:hypothetical protein